MSITKSYNKKTDTYYAYDTVYVWDESKQKKVPKRKCVGQYDPETWEIIPNSRRGRPSHNSKDETVHPQTPRKTADHTGNSGFAEKDLTQMISTLESIESSISALNNTVISVKKDLTDMMKSVSPKE